MTPFQMLYALVYILYAVAVTALIWILIVGVLIAPFAVLWLIVRWIARHRRR